MSVWRKPAEESIDLYPGLVVHDGRVSGSITFTRSRLPMWAIVGVAVTHGWDEVERGWPTIVEYEWDAARLGAFLHDLTEMRGEFARLLLVLADAERCERFRYDRPWWQTKRHRKRVADQLRRCLEALDE